MRRVGVVLFPDVEDLDFVGPLEVWGMAARLRKGEIELLTVAQDPGPIRTSFGLVITPEHTFESAPRIDILVVPGGGGAWANLENERLLGWIRESARGAEIASSVCSGAVLLAAAGVLRSLPATSHWNAMARIRQRWPDIELREGVPWVDAGAVVTSAGVSAGIEMSLHLVQRLFGTETAQLATKWLEYRPWGTASLVPA